MDTERPDPDKLLRQLALEQQQRKRGKLTVFFGAAPGVGKTYAMLQAGRAELAKGRDVVIGVVETHGRFETAALLRGFELIPRRKHEYRGIELQEFDLDAALERRPSLLLVDELAHSNIDGARHSKRWQDVEELLDAGIDVYSTMNVQHVESLNDVVSKITGIVVRETVPDSVLERAHERKLVDLPPDDLLARLREGKVYVTGQAQRAIENFFRKGNLIALRELALRHTAEHVDAQMQAFRRAQGIEQTWAAADQLLVAVSPSPHSASLIRATRRMAGALHARWFAVHVEPARALSLPEAARARLDQNLRLAQQMGAEVATLCGEDATQELLRFARQRNITKLIVGKPTTVRLRDRFRTSLVDKLVRSAGDIDIYVTAGDRGAEQPPPERRGTFQPNVSGFLLATLVSAGATALAWFLFGRDQLPDVVMTYLVGIMWVASQTGFGASLFAALLSVAAYDFVFVPPFLTFAVSDFQHVVTFAVMFLVAVVLSGLTQRVRNQALAAREREARTSSLYELSRELAGAPGTQRVVELAAAHLEAVFACDVAVFVDKSDGRVQALHTSGGMPLLSERESSIAQWVWSNGQAAGLGTQTLSSARAYYIPLQASGGVVGVLALHPKQTGGFERPARHRHLEAFAAQLALALERALLAEQTESVRREIEKEQLRSSLLSSVSHDLRTPLAIITGAASTLLEGKSVLSDETSRGLLEAIFDEAERLNRLIRNLLDMTRLESGAIEVQKEWLPLEEVVGAALSRVGPRLESRSVRVDLAPDLPLVPCDAILLEQVLVNLLENALKYSTQAIDISARAAPGEVLLEVADRGPGIPVGEELRVFEKFHRARHEGSPEGVGLGLAICRAIIAAHNGKIWVHQREGGGTALRFTLPLEGEPPRLTPLPKALEALSSTSLGAVVESSESEPNRGAP